MQRFKTIKAHNLIFVISKSLATNCVNLSIDMFWHLCFFADEQERVQKKTFVNWMNSYLSKVSFCSFQFWFSSYCFCQWTKPYEVDRRAAQPQCGFIVKYPLIWESGFRKTGEIWLFWVPVKSWLAKGWPGLDPRVGVCFNRVTLPYPSQPVQSFCVPAFRLKHP